MKCNTDNLNYDEIPKSLNNTKENSFWQEIMELKPIYQIIFIVLILILLTVIVYLIVRYKNNEINNNNNNNNNNNVLSNTNIIINNTEKQIINFDTIINNAKEQIKNFLANHKNDVVVKDEVFDKNILLHVNKAYFHWENNKEGSEQEELKSLFPSNDINDYKINKDKSNIKEVTNKQIQVKNILCPIMKVEIIFEKRQYDMIYVEFEKIIKSINPVEGYSLCYNVGGNVTFLSKACFNIGIQTSIIEFKSGINIYLLIILDNNDLTKESVIKLVICKKNEYVYEDYQNLF